jgi:hypothetical protein
MSATNLSITKSMLAKLLAGENINVVHKRISTAMFELKTRTLYLPIWEDMDGELYDLLGGHEVGHALYTPEEGWHNAIHDKDGKIIGSFKNVLNIVEDARIEKLIKRRYPGLSKSFVAGYKNLFERDFFGIKKLNDYSKLNILDRINLYAKCGSFLIVPFSDEERELMREVENTETWDQVVELSHRLFELAKKEQDDKLNSLEDLTEELLRQFDEEFGEQDEQEGETQELDLSNDDSEESSDSTQSDSTDEESEEEDTASGKDGEESDDESEDDGEGAGGEDSDEESDEETEGDGGEDSESDEGEEESDDENQTPGNAEGAGEESETPKEDPESITDKKFRERERELIADGVEVYTYNLPKPMLDRIVVPHKVYIDNFYEQLANAKKVSGKNDPISETASKRFGEKNNRYINLLVKEFEMRKNARQYARTSVAKTGELDMSKLHQYKFSNDLFKKISVVEKGKSHGMIMYVDMSGSMSEVFGSTMEQTLVLVAFCRKVNIPFDVYGFSDRRDFLYAMITKKKLNSGFIGQKFQKLNTDAYSVCSDAFHLIHYISSQMQGNAYRRAFDAMATIAMNWKNAMYPRTYLNWENMGIALGGTPFTHTVMASRPMIERFKAENKVDITNVIYLTDGDGTGCFNFTDIKPSPMTAEGKPKIEQHIYLVDPKTRRRVELVNGYTAAKQHQTAMTQFVREVTHCKHIGFYIGSASAMRGYIRSNVVMDETANAEMDKFWRKNGYYSVPMIGYDQYYFVKQTDLRISDDDYDVTGDMSSKKIAKAFTEAQDDKRKHRVLVSSFAKDIAA